MLHSIIKRPTVVTTEARTATIATAVIGLSAKLHCSQREGAALAMVTWVSGHADLQIGQTV